MHNCNAGIKHITYGPNGKFYLCPGFYHNEIESDIGDLKNGIIVKNQQLLTLNKAPICLECDAYQCKRCIYLNKKITREINTPSHAQCVLSHLERLSSKYLLDILNPYDINTKNEKIIPSLNYMDPLDKILNKRHTISMQKKPDISNLPPLKPLEIQIKNAKKNKKKLGKKSIEQFNNANMNYKLTTIYQKQEQIFKMQQKILNLLKENTSKN